MVTENHLYYQTCVQLCCPWGYSNQPNPDNLYDDDGNNLTPNEPVSICQKDDELDFMYTDITIFDQLNNR